MTGLPGLVGERLANQDASWPVASSEVAYDDGYIGVRVDEIVDGTGHKHSRSIVGHKGGVAIVALDGDRVLLVRQYRHAVGQNFVEIPAGVLDVEGEEPLAAAQRELAEEADLVADCWTELVTVVASPGFCTESVTVFLATGLAQVSDDDRTRREAEEATMEQWWIGLDDVVSGIFAGEITDAKTVSAILALRLQKG